jgi:hypothetical protein
MNNKNLYFVYNGPNKIFQREDRLNPFKKNLIKMNRFKNQKLNFIENTKRKLNDSYEAELNSYEKKSNTSIKKVKLPSINYFNTKETDAQTTDRGNTYDETIHTLPSEDLFLTKMKNYNNYNNFQTSIKDYNLTLSGINKQKGLFGKMRLIPSELKIVKNPLTIANKKENEIKYFEVTRNMFNKVKNVTVLPNNIFGRARKTSHKDLSVEIERKYTKVLKNIKLKQKGSIMKYSPSRNKSKRSTIKSNMKTLSPLKKVKTFI